jgi:hypothetical protein
MDSAAAIVETPHNIEDICGQKPLWGMVRPNLAYEIAPTLRRGRSCCPLSA